jgi:four helix bundle protein
MTEIPRQGEKRQLLSMFNVQCSMLNVQRRTMAMDIQERTFQFAFAIVGLSDFLMNRGGAARLISRQLLKSGTSVGANLEEASGAQSKTDFVSKCSIATKEARETKYWLRLTGACKSVPPERTRSLLVEADEIVAILTTIVKRASSSPFRGTPDFQS